MLRIYDIPAPSPEHSGLHERLAASVRAVVKGVEQGHIPCGQYAGVLIDEAHDFEPEWLALAARWSIPTSAR